MKVKSSLLTSVIILALMVKPGLLHCASINFKTGLDYKNAFVYIVGEIKKGDAQDFVLTISSLLKMGTKISRISIYSPGGDALEAMEMGRWIRKLYLPTSAPLRLSDESPDCEEYLKGKRCTCASAGFLLWASGVKRDGSVVGIHRPHFEKEVFSGLSAQQAKKKYEEMSLAVKKYLTYMNVPETLIDKMFETGSDTIEYLDQNTIDTMGKVPFYDEWIKSACAAPLTDEEQNMFRFLFIQEKLAKEGKAPYLSNEQKTSYGLYKAKYQTYYNCTSERSRAAQMKAYNDLNSEIKKYLANGIASK